MLRRVGLGVFLIPLVLFGGGPAITRPDAPPQPREQPAPEYPLKLKEQRIVGSAQLQGVIDENGDVRDLVIVEATQEEFGRAAVAAVSRWKYAPAQKAGRPCAVIVGLPVSFALTAEDLAELDARRAKEALPPGPATLTIEEVDDWPVLRKEISPKTPARLEQERRTGQATMAFIVDEQGTPRDVHALVTTHAECAAAAAAVIRQWRFKPGHKTGRPVRTAIEATLVFFPANYAVSGLRARVGVRTGDDGLKRLPRKLQEALATEMPRYLEQTPPQYPWGARTLSGRVVVALVIDAKGRVTSVRSLEATNQAFAVAAERAVSHWTLQPAKVGGVPVACRAEQRIDFDSKWSR